MIYEYVLVWEYNNPPIIGDDSSVSSWVSGNQFVAENDTQYWIIMFNRMKDDPSYRNVYFLKLPSYEGVYSVKLP